MRLRPTITLCCVLAFPAGGLLAGELPAGGLPAQEPAISVFHKRLGESELDTRRGGDRTEVFNTITLNGTADNIRVYDTITGNNTIGGGSFAGARGFPTVIQNSGNGVLIQNATIINVTVRP